MHDVNFYGIPSIKDKTPAQAIQILYDHCHQTALLIEAMNKEIEALKLAVAGRR